MQFLVNPSLRILNAALLSSSLLLAQAALADPYTVVAVSNGGTIEGVVKLTGEAPGLAPIKVTKNQDYCGASILVRSTLSRPTAPVLSPSDEVSFFVWRGCLWVSQYRQHTYPATLV